VTVASGSPAESYTYDQLGRITQAQESVDGTPYAVNYTYNSDNSLASESDISSIPGPHIRQKEGVRAQEASSGSATLGFAVFGPDG